MNKFAVASLLGMNVLTLATLVGGAVYALRTKKELEGEIEDAKKQINKTVHKFAATLAEFEV